MSWDFFLSNGNFLIIIYLFLQNFPLIDWKEAFYVLLSGGGVCVVVGKSNNDKKK
jgi:hypothetical protein